MSDFLECDEYSDLDDLLQDNMDFLVRRINVTEIFSRLRGRRAITETDQETIEAKTTTIEKNSKLIDVVRRNGGPAMKTLMMCLEYDYGDVYCKITNKQPSDPPPDWPIGIRKSMARESFKCASKILDELRMKEKNREAVDWPRLELQFFALRDKVCELQHQLVARADECSVKQSDITKLIIANNELKEENRDLKRKLADAETVKDKYMREINTLRSSTYRRGNQGNNAEDQNAHQGLQLNEELDPFQQMLSDRDMYRAKVSELETKIESMRVKTEKEEERRSAAEDIKVNYQNKCEHLQRQLSRKSGGHLGCNSTLWQVDHLLYSLDLPDVPERPSEDTLQCRQLEPYNLHYPELKEWNLYYEVTDKIEVKVDTDFLKEVELVGGNLCGCYVNWCPKTRATSHEQLRIADEIQKITLEERSNSAVKTTQYTMRNLCLDSVKHIIDRMPDTGVVTVTKQYSKNAHQLIKTLSRKGKSGGDCFCINVLNSNKPKTNGDLTLEPGMIILVTYTDYKEGASLSSSRRYWYGHVLNPDNGDEVEKRGKFPSFLSSGRTFRRQLSSTAERMGFRYVYPCRVKHKRPVAILASDKHGPSIFKTLADSEFFRYCNSDYRSSSYQNIVSGVADKKIISYSLSKVEEESFGCLTMADLQDVIQQHDKHVLLQIDVEAIGRMVRAKMTPIVIVVKHKAEDMLDVQKSLENHLILQPYEYKIMELSTDELNNPQKLRTYVSTMVTEIQKKLVWVEDTTPVEPF